MKPLHEALEQSIANKYQIATHRRAPVQYVYVHNRFYGDEKKDKMKVKVARLPGVIEIDTKWAVESPAGSFSIVCENEDGLLTPDYYYEKFPIHHAMRGHLHSPWIGQLDINTKIEIHFGYGDRTLREMTGLIDDVSVNPEDQTITIKGRSMYKRMIDNTCKPAPGYKYTLPKKSSARGALERLFKYAGVEVYDPKHIYEPHTGKWYTVDGEQGKRSQNYDEVARKITDTTNHSIFENQYGRVTWFETPAFYQEQKAVYTIDGERVITEMEYSHNDTKLFGTVLVGQGEEKKGYTPFSNKYIRDQILGGAHKEKKIDVEWADTRSKRKLAAVAEFRRMLYEFKKISVTIPANPALQLYDVVRIDERISTQQFNYHVRSINTTYDENGLFQKLELSSSFGYSGKKPHTPDKPINVIDTIVVKEDELILQIYDIGLQGDGDMVAVRYNNTVLDPGHFVSKTPKKYPIKLVPGNNHIKFIGISAGRTGNLSFTGQLLKKDGTPIGSTKTFMFPRDKYADELGFFTGVKPIRHWVVVYDDK